MPISRKLTLSRQTQERLYDLIVRAESYSYKGVLAQNFVRELNRLPRQVYSEMIHWLRCGYPSPVVTGQMFLHEDRGALRTLTFDELCYRVELLRRKYVTLYEGEVAPTAEDWKPSSESSPATEPAQNVFSNNAVEKTSTGNEAIRAAQAYSEPPTGNHHQPSKAQTAFGSEPTAAPSSVPPPMPSDIGHATTSAETKTPVAGTEQARSTPDAPAGESTNIAAILSEVRQCSPAVLDLIVHLLLARATPLVISGVIAHLGAGDGVPSVSPEEWRNRIELVTAHLERLRSDWQSAHVDTGEDYDALADYLRRELRGNRIELVKDRMSSGPPETFCFTSDELAYRNPLDELATELQNQLVERLSTGECATAVTHWLVQQPDREPLRNATFDELLLLVERKRRTLFYGVKSSLRDLGLEDEGCVISKKPASKKADAAAALAFRWALAHVPEPLYRNLVRVLVQGGDVQAKVLRISGQLQEDSQQAGNGKVASSSPRKRVTKAKKLDDGNLPAKSGDSSNLAKLPPYLFEEVVRLLAHGAKATVTARFILSHEDLGDCPRLSWSTMRQATQYLRRQVLKEVNPLSNRQRLIVQIAKHIRQHQIQRQTVLLARQVSPSMNISPDEMVPKVESLKQIRLRLAELFLTDPHQWLAQLTELRGANEPS